MISHRWGAPEHPDPQGVQMRALKEYLLSHPKVRWVWYDFSCMPQGRHRTAEEVQEFRTMLRSVNLLFIGCAGLILLDASYISRFWTMLEAWLMLSTPTKAGFQKASAAEQQVTIVPIHSASDHLVEFLQTI